MSFARWAMVLVPLILLLGFASARAVPAGDESRWYAALVKPEGTPPGWIFPVAWAAIYVLMGFALALIVNARGARGRGLAVALFAAGFVLALVWMPLFFGGHKVDAALIVLAAMLLLGIATTIAFGRIRRGAAWLMVPYLAWASFAGVLTWRIGQLNPDADVLVPTAHTSQML